MITPKEITQKAENKIPEVLLAWLEDRNIFPLVLRSNKQLTSSTFDALNRELSLLLKSSKEAKGFGYRVELKEVNTRKLGKQKLPESIVFDYPSDYWKYLEKEKQWLAFQKDSNLIRERLPQLEEWLKNNPAKILSNIGKWDYLVEICTWFIENPIPNCYLREIPVQPHTKFIEENKSIIEQLLTTVIEPFINKTGDSFEERFHLKVYERFVQIRLLDKNTARIFNGLTHLGITLSDLSEFNLTCKRIIVLENKSSYSNVENFLTLPQLQDTVAIFGSGFAVSRLKEIAWLAEKEILYWGDIDTHGFLILNQFRQHFSHVRSFLMDKGTLMKYRQNWTKGAAISQENPENLTKDEFEVFQFLKENNLRLEQERITQNDVNLALSHIT